MHVCAWCMLTRHVEDPICFLQLAAIDDETHALHIEPAVQYKFSERGRLNSLRRFAVALQVSNFSKLLHRYSHTSNTSAPSCRVCSEIIRQFAFTYTMQWDNYHLIMTGADHFLDAALWRVHQSSDREFPVVHESASAADGEAPANSQCVHV